MRAVAKHFRVSLPTVERWIHRAGAQRLDRVDFSDRPSGCRTSPRRVSREREDLVLQVRLELKEASDLGEFGAAAIRQEFQKRGIDNAPSIPTIGRILLRRGALDGKRRIRRPAPPPGWYLPDLVAGKAELDSFDLIEDLRIENGPLVDVLTGISLHGGLAVAWPNEAHSNAQWIMARLIEHWSAFGLPAYVQFDNDTRFCGARLHPDTIGSVAFLCMQLGVVPVFTPPRETGFQASVENFNGRWQSSVWSRFHHESLASLEERSRRYITALRARNAQRSDGAPFRRRFPQGWKPVMQGKPTGRLIYLRRTDDQGYVCVLGHAFLVHQTWLHRLVRCEVDLDAHRIGFVTLRRQCPSDQLLLNEAQYWLPERRFTHRLPQF